MEIDWKGKLYCGISLDWQYDAKYVNISMPNYVHKQLIRYNPDPPMQPQYSPYDPKPANYGKRSDGILVEPDSPLLGQVDKVCHLIIFHSLLVLARGGCIVVAWVGRACIVLVVYVHNWA